MTTSEQPRIRKPGRPRSEQAHQAILDATLDLLAEKGYELTSIEEIAERAGVGKTTIYRRWSSKFELVVDAMKHLHTEFAIVDSGNLREDFTTILRTTTKLNASRFEALFLKMMGELQNHPDLFEMFRVRLSLPRVQYLQDMIERAKARGEIRPDVDSQLAIEMLGGPFVYRKMLEGPNTSIPDDWADKIVDLLFRGMGIHEKEGQD